MKDLEELLSEQQNERDGYAPDVTISKSDLRAIIATIRAADAMATDFEHPCYGITGHKSVTAYRAARNTLKGDNQ